ncbi:MAG: hypothetical protein QM773_05850 [Hyphomonadaceae bacterium]
MRRVFTAALAACALAPAALAQLPRTPDGKPDLQGLWVAETVTPMQRPKDFKSLVIAPEDAAAASKKMLEDPGEVYDPEFDSYHSTALLSVNGELRSSWIVMPADGRLPLTTLARAARNQERPEYDNPEERDPAERCIDSLAHAPIRAVNVVIPYLFVQTPDAFVITAEDMDPTRIVDLSGRPHPSVIRTRTGDSNGHWDGDTLVIETDHFAAVEPGGLLFRNAALVSQGSRVIERLRLISPDTISYQFTIEDPALYTAPWLAELTLTRTTGPFLDYACHEGNDSIVHILQAARLGKQKPPKKDDKKDDKPKDDPKQAATAQ